MPAGIESILALEVPVIVQIAERFMPVEDVLSMAPGAIIELPKSANDDLEILVNNKIIGTGTAVKVGENFGIRVAYIGDLTHRLSAMSGGTEPGAPEAESETTPPDEPDGEEASPES
ncbi:MAG: FliM/FliN family flagellar motor C-terminal domain-containing protein [Planctomycetota bacterium]|jgi:flagellar motor switch protein FliN/FliY